MSKARSSVAVALVAALVSSLTVMAPQAAVAATAQLSSDLDEHAWHFNSMPLADIHDAGVDGSGVVVAIIDDAIDTTHPDLAGKVTSAWMAFPDRLAAPASMPLPGDRFHGTHVGGIVVALDNDSGTTGVAPGATLLSYDVFHPATQEWDVTQFSEALARAIVHAGSRANVINMSLGGPDFVFSADDRQLVCDAIGAATTAGALVVVAAGNDGGDPFFANPLSIPAGCEQALAVASLDCDLNASKFTSFGEHLTVSAPGADILAPVPATTLSDFFGLDETNAVVSLSGTSMASPLVAGVAALIIDQNPTLTPAQVRDRITTTALDLGAAGPDSLYGAGVVDPASALSLALPSPSAALHPTVLSAGLDLSDETKLRVAWRPANGGPALTGIDVVFWTESGVVTESLPGNRVSVVVDPPADAGWVHVVAHTASGSYASSLAPFRTGGGGAEPDPFEFSAEDVTWTADGELMVEWTSVEPIPAGATLQAYLSTEPRQTGLDRIDITLDFTLPTDARSGSLAIDVADEMMAIGSLDGPLFEPSQRTAVARFASGFDWRFSYYLQTDPDGFDGTAEGFVSVDALHPLAALGVAAGQREAEVTIIVPSSRWSQICEVDPCPAARIDVVASGETVSGRLTPFFRSTLQVPRPWGARSLPADVTVQRLVEDFDALIPIIESAAVGITGEDVASDVPFDHPFASDIGWLYAEGLTSGCSGDAFCPEDTVTRGQMTAFLRRAFAAQADPGTAASFSDVGSSVFAGDIAWASAAGVTSGCAPGRFCPDDPVTRGQMAAFLRRLLGDDISPGRMPAIFDDTVNSVFGDDIAWLSATGITAGCTANRFCPNDSITRGQMAAFVRRAHTAVDR